MGEPTAYTDVIDALDEPDPFDLNVTVGFSRALTAGTIQRENPTGDGRTATYNDIADHERLTNTLMLGLDVGVFHDLAIYARMPIVLSDERTLRRPDNATLPEVNQNLAVQDPPAEMGGAPTPTQLFSVPFTAPTRSGVDYLALGVQWALFNQFRDPEYPNWVVIGELRAPLGAARRPCFDEAPAGRDRCYNGDEPGVSDGVLWARFETRISRRFRYLEPYAGLSFAAGFPTSGDKLFSPGGDLSGFMNTAPPREGEFTVGSAIVPWEHRGRWQRFSIDLRLAAAYISEGHGYSPLFDALGTSPSRYLRENNRECPDASTCNREVPFSGLTDMQAHGKLSGRLALEMQAARYVRFNVAGTFAYATPYMLTYSDACNPNLDPDEGDPRIGSCRNGIINPHHRPAIDLPGNRFRVDGEVSFDLSVTATAQF